MKRSYRTKVPPGYEPEEPEEGGTYLPPRSYFEKRAEARGCARNNYRLKMHLGLSTKRHRKGHSVAPVKVILKLWETFVKERARRRSPTKFNLQKHKSFEMSWAHTRARGRVGGRPKVDPKVLEKAFKMYDSKIYSISEIQKIAEIGRATLYKYLEERKNNQKTITN